MYWRIRISWRKFPDDSSVCRELRMDARLEALCRCCSLWCPCNKQATVAVTVSAAAETTTRITYTCLSWRLTYGHPQPIVQVSRFKYEFQRLLVLPFQPGKVHWPVPLWESTRLLSITPAWMVRSLRCTGRMSGWFRTARTLGSGFPRWTLAFVSSNFPCNVSCSPLIDKLFSGVPW